MIVKNRGTLFGKTFIPFGKEGGIWDEFMTTITQQQNHFLRSTKQCIVQNLNDIDYPIDIVTGSAEDMDADTGTLQDMSTSIKTKMEDNCSTLSKKQKQVGHTYSSFMSARRRLLTI
jgi:hypothetical protein